jgi:hypothetical protein
VGPWIRVISSSTLERKHKCDPRVGNGSRIFHMDRATLAWPGGPIGRSGDLHMVGPPAHLPLFVLSCIKTPQGISELVIDKICSCHVTLPLKSRLLTV